MLANSTGIGGPYALAFDGSGGNMFVASYVLNRVLRINMATNQIYGAVGNGAQGSAGDGGPASSAALEAPFGLALDRYGNLYVSAQNASNRVRVVSGISVAFPSPPSPPPSLLPCLPLPAPSASTTSQQLQTLSQISSQTSQKWASSSLCSPPSLLKSRPFHPCSSFLAATTLVLRPDTSSSAVMFKWGAQSS